MRQIKFKGKSLVNGKWVCGDSIKHTENASENGTEVLTYIGERVPNARKVGAMKWIPVDPGSIGQFTGLLDRNGKEIYEGDIITVRGNYPRVILWDKVSWAIMPCELYNNKHFWLMNLQHPGSDWWEEFADEMEIVGNIHDNPELMNKEQSKS
ncbi:MAG: YopX family protein [Staphylococcus sp.]|nr:YopX family protein [Staphylococcus sp.]